MNNRLSTAERKAIIAFGVNNGYIELSETERQSEQIIANKLITTLLYECNRHGWNAAHCVTLRQHIVKLLPDLQGKSRKDYESYIYKQETDNGTFYGSYLSDDSDSDEEAGYLRKSPAEKKRLREEGDRYQHRAQIDKMTYQKTTAAGNLKLGKEPSSMFDLNARATIHHGDDVNKDKTKRDLNDLNHLLKEGKSIEAALETLRAQADEKGEVFTEFYLAEYRGVTHLTTKWNKPARTAHRRDPDEIGKRQYSASIYKAAGVSLFRDYNTAKTTRLESPQLFDNPAEELREIILTFREPRPYSYKNYTYSNLAYLLQNIYTQDYYGFHEQITSDSILRSVLLNDANPFFSMGDTPYHANKYAYGLKPYEGHEGDRIRPRWNAELKAERPYSGVVYTSLHPINDYTSDGPLHLITLNRNAEIKLKSELIIIAERESCFPAYLPEDRIIHKHIAKYPSFKGPYKNIYFYKYGLTEALYNKFKEGFSNAKPHTDDNRSLKKLLGEWLCSFYEVKLIDIARQQAEAKQGVLIYRDTEGTFSLTPPVDSVNRNSSAITAEIKTPVKEKQKKRASFASSEDVIKPIFAKNAVEKIVGDIDQGDESETESASVAHEGNHGISLPLSLMLNAIKNQRYRALKRFLTIPAFKDAINEKFNSDGLEGATLLHLAAARNDLTAIKLLTSLEDCSLGATADELCVDNEDKIDFYEEITPCQLAIMRHCNEAATFLLNHPRNDRNAKCAYVRHKDLYENYLIEASDDEDDYNNDNDHLGTALYRGKNYNITRTRDVTLHQLASEFNNKSILSKLGVDEKKRHR